MDLTGQKFGRWTVIEYEGTKGEGKHKCHCWKCQCECGNVKIVREWNLKSGNSRSCGCLVSDSNKINKTTHGKRNTRLYRIWMSMRNRCNNKNSDAYEDYGGRGISVFPEWENDFMSFYGWSIKNGYSKELTIDRVDVNGNYEPNNCRWVDMRTQCNNRRNNHVITYKGKTKTVSEWERELGFKKDILQTRISNGWSIEKAIETPYENRKFKHEYGYSSKIRARIVTINGVSHSVKEWCEILGINQRTVVDRIEKGMTEYDALTTPTKKVARWSREQAAKARGAARRYQNAKGE